MRSSCCALLFSVACAESFEEIVAAVNTQQRSWVAALPTRVASVEEVKPYLGAYLPGDAKYQAPAELLNANVAENIPDSFDAREQWPQCTGIAEVRDQSACGSCWAFGSVDSFQDRACISTGKDIRYSPEDTAFCSDAGDGCQGGNTAWMWFHQEGVVSGGKFEDTGKGDTCLPYSLAPCAHHVPASSKYPACPAGDYDNPVCESKCSEAGYSGTYATDKLKASKAYAVRGVSQIQTDLMTHGPMYVAFTVYGDFETYKSGVYKHTTGGFLGGHAVELVGWGTESGEDYWLIKNSWNEEWGDEGFFKIARGVNECGIEDSVSAGTIGDSPSPGPSPTPGGCDLSIVDLLCGDAKMAGGPSICRGCADAHDDELADDGCSYDDYATWCDESAVVV